MRPSPPHAAESGVGKHTARERERAQACVTGKECVAHTHPPIWPRDRKVPGPYFSSWQHCPTKCVTDCNLENNHKSGSLPLCLIQIPALPSSPKLFPA